jgi:hypothetical protein
MTAGACGEGDVKEVNETLSLLQAMREDDLTRNVLAPLFGKLGYVDVHFHGGPYEQGKDLIAFKHEAFGRISVLVAQVKRFRSSRSAATSRQWGEIVHQLRQALIKPIPCKDGQERTPATVAFITPYPIDVRLLEEQFEVVQLKGIEIIDGAALYNEILRTWPSLLSDIGNVGDKIQSKNTRGLSNVELFESLKVGDDIAFENVYSDLNFFVGRTETRELICSTIEATELPKNVSFETWLAIKQNLLEVEKLTQFELISSQVTEIEGQYASSLRKYCSAKNIKRAASINDLTAKARVLAEKIQIATERIHHDLEGMSEHKRTRSLLDTVRQIEDITDLMQSGESVSIDTVVAVAIPIGRIPMAFRARVGDLYRDFFQLSIIEVDKRQERAKYVAEPTVTFSLDLDRLCDYISSSIQWLRDNAKKVNSEDRRGFDLREFLARIELLLSVVNRLVHTKTFGREVFRLRPERYYENRFAISAHEVFDTGMNVAVYGEAGAGKSTTLHIYVKRKARQLSRNDKEALVFLPMNRMMSARTASGFNEQADVDKGAHIQALLKCILIYVGAEPSDSSVEEFTGWIKSRARITFVIDGLDEAVTNNKWLLPAINGIPGAFVNAQVIISSRDCIAEIADIQFLGITLLPFTQPQIKRFIEGWNPQTGPALWEAIKTQNLVEVAKNPLLATIVCSLHQHGIALPANEPEVYRKYLALLCGQYDAFKGVERTSCPQELLERVARAIAFGMHELHLREIDLPGLNKILKAAFRDVVTESALILATEELISPCGVLKRVPQTGLVTFGHLRYQEYLASEEFLKSNRRSVLDYLDDDWWKGALYLYAFSADLEELMMTVYRTERSFARASAMILHMIEARPSHERPSLRNQLRVWQKQELRDDVANDHDDARDSILLEHCPVAHEASDEYSY